MSWRSKKLLASAEGRSCIRCGSVGTTVACHANSVALGKGTGIKAPDFYSVHFCAACHDLYDGRRGNLTREQKQEMFTSAFFSQVARWFEQDIVAVK